MTDEHRATYERDGVVCLRNVLSQTWLDRLREGVEINLANPGPLCDEHVPPGQPGASLVGRVWSRATLP